MTRKTKGSQEGIRALREGQISCPLYLQLELRRAILFPRDEIGISGLKGAQGFELL